MKKVLIIATVAIIAGLVACSKHKNTQQCEKKTTENAEVKEKVEDAAKAVGTAVKTKVQNAADTVTTKTEAIKTAAETKAADLKREAERKTEQEKKKAGEEIVKAAENLQKKLDD